MITCNIDDLSIVKMTKLQPGELFAHSGGSGNFAGVVIENDDERFMSWMCLTGNNRFHLQCLEGGVARAHSPNVLRLGIHWNELRVQIDETRVERIGVVPDVGCLLVVDQPRIVTKYWAPDDRDEVDAYGISLRDLSRQHVSQGGYCCAKWRLVYVPKGLPPEVIAEFDNP